MTNIIRKALIAGGLTAAALVGGGIGGAMLNGVADAQTSTSTPASENANEDKPAVGARHGRGCHHGEPLSAEELEKAEAAALEAVPGAEFKGARKAHNGTIHAHLVKEDGTHVHVVMDENYKVTKVEDPARPPRHRHGPRGARPGNAADAPAA